MNKLFAICAGLCLAASSMGAHAEDSMKHDGMMMDANCMAMHHKMMDKNGDGMISKDEYMDGMKAQWEKMPKSKDGMASMDDMKKGMMMAHDECGKNDEGPLVDRHVFERSQH